MTSFVRSRRMSDVAITYQIKQYIDKDGKLNFLINDSLHY